MKIIQIDGKIHCVYAGTLDTRKGGAMTAIATASYLPENYHMHILGFGNNEDVSKVKNAIAESLISTRCYITYDGVLRGEEYIRFLQSCDIGMSTQNPNLEFNGTSFPSKILTYMANGLQVVSVRIPAIEKSKISPYLQFYDGNNPEDIAKTITQMDFKKNVSSLDVLAKLDIEFGNELDDLITQIQTL